ncbi:hypothetical protein LINGRAHAP2_LOCUS15500 [Linum grandiflorum]
MAAVSSRRRVLGYTTMMIILVLAFASLSGSTLTAEHAVKFPESREAKSGEKETLKLHRVSRMGVRGSSSGSGGHGGPSPNRRKKALGYMSMMIILVLAFASLSESSLTAEHAVNFPESREAKSGEKERQKLHHVSRIGISGSSSASGGHGGPRPRAK